MKKGNITALTSAFARAYHNENSLHPIYEDELSRKLFTDDEYKRISQFMGDGIEFFSKTHNKNASDKLDFVVNNFLAPTPLTRAAFNEKALLSAVTLGANKYLMLGAGFDMFGYKNLSWTQNIDIIEVDLPDIQLEKIERIKNAKIDIPNTIHFLAANLVSEDWSKKLIDSNYFDKDDIVYCSLLGLVYYITEEEFDVLLSCLNRLLNNGSTIVFDYPIKSFESEVDNKIKAIAEASSEPMKASYTLKKMTRLLEKNGFLIYEALGPEEIDNRFCREYNLTIPQNEIHLVSSVGFILAVKNPVLKRSN